MSNAKGDEAYRVLTQAGLPRAFVLTQRRLDSELNVLTEGFQHTQGGLEMDKVHAKL